MKTTGFAATLLCSAALAGCLSCTGCSAPQAAQPSVSDDAVLESVLADFEQLAAIPRPSHHEGEVGAFLLQWAQDRGYRAHQDDVGNVIFDVPATQGREQAPLTVLQGHMDMVAVSDDPAFDAMATPIETVRTEETLTANGTSLGADDGIGVATIMSYLAADAEHGPLRVVVTVNEEDGMTGVVGLDAGVVADASYLINLDAEVLGEANVSAAGAVVTTATRDSLRRAPTLDSAVEIKLEGMQGGHSALVIGSGRINAVRALGDLLLTLKQDGVAFQLAALEGGRAVNAVPTSASALIAVGSSDVGRVRERVEGFAGELAEAHYATDPDVRATVSDAAMPHTVFDAEQQEDILTFVTTVPDGVRSMSAAVEGLIETSSNLGVVQADENGVSVAALARGSQEVLLDSLCLGQRQLAERCGFAVVQDTVSDPWPPSLDSTLQPIVQEAYREATGEEMRLVSIHAGLECGTFALLNPELDIIAIGPQIRDAHSVDETLYLESVVPFYRTLEGTLARLSEPQA